MIFKGFQFGMLLQFAIGPVCIFIFQAASSRGFLITESGVFGVALIDALYILASIIGIGGLIEKNDTVKIGLKVFGAFVLILFGLSNILNIIGINFLPSLHLQSVHNTTGMFSRAALLTLSNPLTIVFWAGAFSSKIAQESYRQKDLFLFGFGAVMATLFFLSLVSFAGSITKIFLPLQFIEFLNGVVGIALIYFGIRTATKKGVS
ncbi:MAG: LysE family transporter [Chloroflexi bacterium]|nr:LysE family transporter [Chloroflexota bacterium]